MADEKLNTGPAENISPEAAEPIATPEQAVAPQQAFLRALRPAKISECGHTRIACQNAQPATWRKKTEVTLSFTFPPFLSMLSSLGL